MDDVAIRYKSFGDRFDDPENYTGYTLHDPVGGRVGAVQKLFVNDDGTPEYVRVKLGFFGSKKLLLPVESVEVNEQKRTLTLR